MPLSGLILLVFIGLSLVLFLLFYYLLPRKTIVEERLAGMTEQAEAEAYFERPPTSWQKFLGNIGGRVPLSPRDYNKYMKDMVAAGYHPGAIPIFMGSKLFLAVALPVAFILFYGAPTGMDRTPMVILSIILAILGFLLPTFWLRRKTRTRQLRIFHDLPDVLDLMTVSVEAGLSMDASILRISSDRQFSASPLSKELRQTVTEVRAGKPRADALRDLGERTMLDDMKAFAAMMIQTEKLGTSLADSLRVHSDSLRTIRRQRAEEAAAKTSIKLLFPLVFLIMPALFVVMLLPALLRIAEVFKGI